MNPANPPSKTLLLGSCMLLWPLTRTARADGKLECRPYGPTREIHTFGEMFQLLESLRDGTSAPRDLIHLTHLPKGHMPSSNSVNFSDLDLTLLSPSSPVEITFRGIALNRMALQRKLIAAVKEETGEAEKLSSVWLRQGIIGLNRTIREEIGERLIGFIKGATEDAEQMRSVIREIQVSRTDIPAGFRNVLKLMKCPVGVVLYTFRYMPDGRAISWPAGFREEVLAAAREMSLPVFDPATVVGSYGAAKAMEIGFSHYRAEFLPIIGEAIVDFAMSIRRSSSLSR